MLSGQLADWPTVCVAIVHVLASIQDYLASAFELDTAAAAAAADDDDDDDG